MRLSRYREYQHVGGWLQQIPCHWGVSRLRWHTQRYSGGTPDKQRPEFWTDGTVPWLNSGAVNEPVIREPSEMITELGFNGSSAKWIPAGALVIALAGQGRTKGTVAQVAIRTTCNQSMAAIVPGSKLHARFLYWWLAGNYQNIRNMSGGDLRDGLNLELLGDISCPLPPLDEQRSIASFLDRETTRIDALVAEQERLVLLLREKREAVISHAVTKGLNPDAPMKPSGVGWLGDVPMSWTVVELKRVVSFQRGHDLPADARQDGHVPVVSSAGSLGTHDTACAKAPGIVTGRYGSIGEFYFIEQDYWPLNTALYSIDLHGNHPRYVWYLLQSISELFVGESMKSAVPGVDRNDIHVIRVVRAAKSDQHRIVEFLDAQTKRIDELDAGCRRAISLLDERRGALISAAVTGQIDVQQLAQAELA